MSSARSPLSGQEIAQAANATRALLDSLLAETETFHRWVILNSAGSGGGSVARDAVVARMQSALKVDVATASAAVDEVDEVVALGLAMTEEDRLILTPDGAERYEQIRAGSAAIVERLYDGLPIEDLLTTRRILTTVTERANGELARKDSST
jgi:exopolyphosphatase/pppGpp-phosphohydrolase